MFVVGGQKGREVGGVVLREEGRGSIWEIATMRGCKFPDEDTRTE